jgi:hypothetical protein
MRKIWWNRKIAGPSKNSRSQADDPWGVTISTTSDFRGRPHLRFGSGVGSASTGPGSHGAQVPEWGSILQDFVRNHQDLVRLRHDSLTPSSRGFDPVKQRAQVNLLGVGSRPRSELLYLRKTKPIGYRYAALPVAVTGIGTLNGNTVQEMSFR